MLMLHLAGGGTVSRLSEGKPRARDLHDPQLPRAGRRGGRRPAHGGRRRLRALRGGPRDGREGDLAAARGRRSRGSRIPPGTSSPCSISRLIGVTDLAIRLRGAVKRYGPITAVDGLDLDVPEGTCVGLLGPNGAGKSTTMRLLTAQSIADEGEIEVLGSRCRTSRRPRARSAASCRSSTTSTSR